MSEKFKKVARKRQKCDQKSLILIVIQKVALDLQNRDLRKVRLDLEKSPISQKVISAKSKILKSRRSPKSQEASHISKSRRQKATPTKALNIYFVITPLKYTQYHEFDFPPLFKKSPKPPC